MALLTIWGVTQGVFAVAMGGMFIYEATVAKPRRERIITVKTVKLSKNEQK